MNDTSKFILDANVFIEAARRYYAFDLAPCFWEALNKHANNGQVSTIDRIKDELEKGNDELSRWIKQVFYQWCDTTNQSTVISAYGDIMKWVNSESQYSPEAKASFAAGADGWLIAYAAAKHYIVVTHERFDSRIKRRVPIPNVCREFDVQYLDTFQMLRKLDVKFI